MQIDIKPDVSSHSNREIYYRFVVDNSVFQSLGNPIEPTSISEYFLTSANHPSEVVSYKAKLRIFYHLIYPVLYIAYKE